VEEKWHNYDNWSRALGLCQPPARGRIPSTNANRGPAWSAQNPPAPSTSSSFPPPLPLSPPPPWGRWTRTTSNIRLATQLYRERPTGGRGQSTGAREGENLRDRPELEFVHTGLLVRQRAGGTIIFGDRGVKLYPEKRDNRPLGNCPPKSSSSSSSSSSPTPRRHDFTIRRRRARRSDASRNKSPSVPCLADLHAKEPSTRSTLVVTFRRRYPSEKEEGRGKSNRHVSLS